MAYTMQYRTAYSNLAIEISAGAHHMLLAVQDYLAYRATLRALRRLDNAALADVGITSRTIKAHARMAVYGY